MRRFGAMITVLLIAAVEVESRQDVGATGKVATPGLEKFLPLGPASGDQLQPGSSFTFDAWWESGTPRPAPRRLYASIFATSHTGIAINWPRTGGTTEPDYTFVVSDPENAAWEVVSGGDFPYAGVDHIVVRTKEKLAPNVKKKLKITSHDFGGSATVEVRTEETPCHTDSFKIPLDSDNDTLPDRWEEKQWLFDPGKPEAEQCRKFDIEDPSTSIDGTNDGALDSDIGYVTLDTEEQVRWAQTFAELMYPGESFAFSVGMALPSRVHDELGDGFSAFEEYRGVFANGAFSRMDDLANDGGSTSAPRLRGTILKDLFLHDPDALVNAGSRPLINHGIAYHRIRANEMSDEGSTGGTPNTGYVNHNADKDQKGLIVRFGGLPAGVLGWSGGLSVNTVGSPVFVDPTQTASDAALAVAATGALESLADLRNWVVAHEIGHRLGLRHPETTATSVASLPASYDCTCYATATGATVSVWAVTQTLRNAAGTDSVVLLENLVLSHSGPPAADATAVVHNAHGEGHTARRVTYTASPAVSTSSPPRLTYFIHEGDLMDTTHEHAKLQTVARKRSDMKIKG